jgi:glycosyltransferase involved in cell wall biosynthesis
MRIAQIATLATPVRRKGVGSIEGLVWLLSRELTAFGHDVTVFCTAGSDVDGEVVATLPGSYGANGAPDDWHLCEWINMSRAIEQSGRFDLIHSHSYLWSVPLSPISRAPILHTTHVSPGEEERRLIDLYPDAHISAISDYQRSCMTDRALPTIHHGIDAAQFPFSAEPEDYLCFLGRFNWGKGPRTAIAVARELGMPIRLAGPCNDYYNERIAPHVDGEQVIYVGSVGGESRNRLLGGARALLYPINQPEPFGLVLVEAMMCGTPVAAVGLGAVPEIIDEGITGSTAGSPEELAAAVRRVLDLDRFGVRERAVSRFSSERMAREYAALYRSIVTNGSAV